MVSDIVGGLDMKKLRERITKTIGFIRRVRDNYQRKRERDKSEEEMENIIQQRPLQPDI